MSEPIQLEARRSPSILRTIDNTALAHFMECPRKYLYAMILHKRNKGRTKPALAYGTTWHAILEAHYKTGGDTSKVIKAAIDSWQPHENPDDHRTLERALKEYEKYLDNYGNHDAEARVWGRTVGYPEQPQVEQSVEVWWPGALHPYAGKIDRIYEHQGNYYVQDHKTTSQLGAYYFKQFDPSNQMMGYAVIAREISGLPVAGVQINAHAVLKTTSKFERQTIMFSPERLAEWKDNLNAWIERIETAAKTIDTLDEIPPDVRTLAAFPHNFNACAGKYGQCVYSEVCSMPPRIRMQVLENDFDTEAWDPLAEEESGE